TDLWVTEDGCPRVLPCTCRGCVIYCMVQRSHQVRLTKTPFANHDYRTPLVRTNGLNALQQIVGRVGDIQELLRRDLRCASIGVVGELNSCPFEAFASKLFS